MSTDQLDQKRRNLTQTLVDRIAQDPQFRQQLVNDTRGALQAAGLWDAYQEVTAGYSNLDREVSGYAACSPSNSSANCCGSY
jgi:hypothetical protein